MKSFLGLLFLCAAGYAQEPRFTKDDRLVRPTDYREWIFLSSGLGMTYGPAAEGANPDHPRFDNVFVNPRAYKAFLQTGSWPDKTMFILEVRSSVSKGSINNGGHYQDEILAIESAVKKAGKWAYFNFGKSGETTAALPPSAACYACHSKNGAVDNTFVQFYPTLLSIANAKGTVKKEEARSK